MPPAGANSGNANGNWRRNNRNTDSNVSAVSFSSATSSQYPPFFLGAPITKLICILWALGSFWIVRTSTTSGRGYSNHNITTNSVSVLIWDSIESPFFTSSTEAIVGLSFLANYLRRLERELSSRRLVIWLFTVQAMFFLSKLVALLTLDAEVTFGYLSQVHGPYHIVGGVLYWYWMYIPRLHPRFLSLPLVGMSFSEKSFGFVWAMYVLLMGGTSSLLVGIVGMLGSALFFFLLTLPSASPSSTNNFSPPLFSMDIPDKIAELLPWDALGNLFLLDSPPKVFAPLILMNAPRNNDNNNNNIDMALAAGLGRRRQPRPRRPPPAPPAPSPEAIGQLTAMGFDEQRVKEALLATGNNVERAADQLLTG